MAKKLSFKTDNEGLKIFEKYSLKKIAEVLNVSTFALYSIRNNEETTHNFAQTLFNNYTENKKEAEKLEGMKEFIEYITTHTRDRKKRELQ